MTMNKETALVVFSGGQDSTTCLFWAKKHFKKVVALSFVYGQEVELAKAIASRADVDWDCMDVSFVGSLGRNSLTDATMQMDEEKPEGHCPNTFVPGRNLFFISIAAVYARERGVADGLQRLSRLSGRVYQKSECDLEPGHGRTVRLAYAVDVDRQMPDVGFGRRTGRARLGAPRHADLLQRCAGRRLRPLSGL